MRAEGRCGQALGALLICLLALGCERGRSGPGALQHEVAGEGGAPPVSRATPVPRFDLQRVAAELAAAPVLLDPARGAAHPAYARLRELASDAQLRELLQHASPEVRVYAFQALAERQPHSALFAELSVAVADLSVVPRSDARGESTVADLALERVQQRLSGVERDAIARQLLTSRVPQRSAARIKREWTFSSALHEPLRTLARAGEGDVLPALARYRDPDDIPLLAAGLRETTAEHALQAIAEFPDERFLAPLQAFQRRLPGLRSDLLCQLYATALRLPPPAAEVLLAAPFAADGAAADLAAHVTCQRWLLLPNVLRQHTAAGFRLWERSASLLTEQLQVLQAADPARARRLALASAAELGRFSPEAAAWLLRQTEGAERAAALRGLRAALRHASKKELDNLGDLLLQLELRELLPELFARLERSRPLADAAMATFREELTRSLVWQISRWRLSEPERQRLVSWVLGGRAARERDTKDPIGQRIVEDYLVEVLNRARLLQPT